MKQHGCIVPVSMILALVATALLLTGCANGEMFGTRTDTRSPIPHYKAQPHAARTQVARTETPPPVTAQPATVTPDAAPVKPKKKGFWRRVGEKLHLKKKTAE